MNSLLEMEPLRHLKWSRCVAIMRHANLCHVIALMSMSGNGRAVSRQCTAKWFDATVRRKPGSLPRLSRPHPSNTRLYIKTT
jgi:hypothetical protein